MNPVVGAARRTKLLACLLCLLVVSACGSRWRDVTDEAPLTGIDGLQRAGGEIVVDLALRNVNDRAFRLDGLSAELRLEEQPLASGERTLSMQIAPRSREVLTLRFRAEPDGLERLDALDASDRQGIPWQMDLVIRSDSGDYRDATSGWLHPVPGQPGRYR
jgi:LEA14-like dessication related protein